MRILAASLLNEERNRLFPNTLQGAAHAIELWQALEDKRIKPGGIILPLLQGCVPCLEASGHDRFLHGSCSRFDAYVSFGMTNLCPDLGFLLNVARLMNMFIDAPCDLQSKCYMRKQSQLGSARDLCRNYDLRSYGLSIR